MITKRKHTKQTKKKCPWRISQIHCVQPERTHCNKPNTGSLKILSKREKRQTSEKVSLPVKFSPKQQWTWRLIVEWTREENDVAAAVVVVVFPHTLIFRRRERENFPVSERAFISFAAERSNWRRRARRQRMIIFVIVIAVKLSHCTGATKQQQAWQVGLGLTCKSVSWRMKRSAKLAMFQELRVKALGRTRRLKRVRTERNGVASLSLSEV